MRAKVVIINGYPGSGKDAFVDLCKQRYEHVYNHHTSDQAKTILEDLGWDGVKTPEVRKLLADIIAFSYKYDFPFAALDEYLSYVDYNCPRGATPVVFVHCREYENIVKFRQRYNAVTVFVDRPGEQNPSNDSDANAGQHREIYDFTIYNNKDLEALEMPALALMRLLTVKAGNA